jgi:hypothetical protein
MAQKDVSRDSIEPLVDMILGLLADADYRRDANENIEGDPLPAWGKTIPRSSKKAPQLKLRFS